MGEAAREVWATKVMAVEKGEAETAQLAHLAKGLHWEPVFFVYLLSDGFDLVVGKVAHHLADQFLLLVELEMHGGLPPCDLR
jgi:hypothetical protein